MFWIRIVLPGLLFSVTGSLSAADTGFYIGGAIGYSSFDVYEGAGFSAQAPLLQVPFGAIIDPGLLSAQPPDGTIFATGSLPVDIKVNNNLRDDDLGWMIQGGYNINRYFAIEVGYTDPGETSFSSIMHVTRADSTQLIHTNNSSLTINGIQFAGIAGYPVTESIRLFSKLGGYYWRTETDIYYSIESSDNSVIVPPGPMTLSIDDDGTDLVFGAGVEYTLNDLFTIRAGWERFSSITAGDDNIDLYSLGIFYRIDL